VLSLFPWAGLDYILHVRAPPMNKYRITQHDSDFIVTLKAGPTIEVCRTQGEAKQIIEIREHEDLILATARRLLKDAVNELMRTYYIDRVTA
jgi:hypothetical protein